MDSHDLRQLIGLALTPFELAVCAFELAACVLALARGLRRILPFFTTYLILVVIIEAARYAILFRFGYRSAPYSWTFWMTQLVLVVARGAALADICRAALGSYTGLWQLARYLLAGAATFMLAFAAVRTGGTPRIDSYLIFVERELEFCIVISLLVLLVLSRYYGVALNRPLGGMAMGLAFYSSVVITISSIMNGPVSMPWWLYGSTRHMAYLGALGFWAYSMRAPLPEPIRPEMSTVENYERNTRMVSDRMRALNARLMELMKR